MKHINAYKLPLLVALAWALPTMAPAIAGTIPLPARNPERPAVIPNTQPMADAAITAPAPVVPLMPDQVAAPPSALSAPATTHSALSSSDVRSETTASKAPTFALAAENAAPEVNSSTASAVPTRAPNPQRRSETPAEGAAKPESEQNTSETVGTDTPNADKAETKLASADASFMPDVVPEPSVHPRRDPMSPAAPKPALDYGSVLKPLLEYKLSSGDESRLRFVMRHKGSIDDTAAKITDPAARDFGLWYRYGHTKSSSLNAEAVEKFRKTHLMWPRREKLREKAETSLFLRDASPERIKAFFAESEPKTGAGMAALAGVYLKEGKKDEAEKLIDAAWRDDRVNEDAEKKILAKFSGMLEEDDHRARVDVLLYPDRAKAAPAALRVAKQLPEAERKKVKARIAVIKRESNAGKLLDALPDDAVKDDIGLRFNNIQWLRRTKDKEQRLIAWKLLLDAPLKPDLLLDMKEWWIERRVNVRAALNDGHPRTAYEIAAKHGLDTENLATDDQYIEAEFLAGWVALRYLNETPTALRHFLSMRRAAKDSRDVARAEYWLGRTALVLGDRSSAAIHFHVAAKYPQYFYGQLGRQALDPDPARLEVTSTPIPTQADIDRFLSRNAVRAMGVARAAKLQWVTPQFLLSLCRTLDNAAEVVLLAEYAKALGHNQMALRLSKIAFNRDLPMGDYALPVGVMPSFKSLVDERVDPALVHALSRQESEFNAAAQSPVGASGLMQLMPATARGVARRYKVQYSKARLTNAAYNTQLGEAFLSDLINNYDGSYFMALAAYNAGPGRVKEWVGIYGDPRKPDVDPIDWIERIPFTETRRYVIKIMETLQLYRSRLAGPDQALHLVQDLNRGRKVPASETASVVAVSAEPKTP